MRWAALNSFLNDSNIIVRPNGFLDVFAAASIREQAFVLLTLLSFELDVMGPLCNDVLAIVVQDSAFQCLIAEDLRL